ncbi:MAG TPA: TlpA disulfide reductase family protein [Gemmatimonadales bacterium]
MARATVARLALALGIAAATGCTAADLPPAGQVGAPAPAYAAVTLDGDSTSLAALRGRPVLLNVWATWCHPCRTEIPVLQALYERRRDEGLEIVGVSIDAAGEDAAVRAFAREYGMTFPIWRDTDSRVTTLFAALGVPATYLIDRDGTLRWKKVGPIAEGDPELARMVEEVLEQ